LSLSLRSAHQNPVRNCLPYVPHAQTISVPSS
jgi:hypothetical protein